MFHRGWFWIDARSEGFAERMADVIRHYGVVRTGSLEEALQELPRAPLRWAGVVSELRDGDVGTLLSLRGELPALPLLAVLSPQQCARLLNPLQSREVEVALGTVDDTRLTAFVQHAFSRSFHPKACVARVLADMARQANLNPREVQVLASCVGKEPREVLMKRLGISENTLKSQIKGLLRKCGERSVHELAKGILRNALMVEEKDLVPVELAGAAAAAA
jgi:DNA-binding NarL/FixJ family response regulator